MKPKREKILVTVKTYPTPSSSHFETVCTAGIRENGDWIRLYPIPFRFMLKEQRFSKYQWIEANILRDHSDPRFESHKISGEIWPLEKLGTENNWEERKDFILNNVYTNLEKLIDEARDVDNFVSLAVFKPHKIISFSIKKDKSKADVARKRKSLQRILKKSFAKSLAEKVPYKFYYTFKDKNGKRSTLQIIDWEIYQLCRKLIQKYGNKKDVLYKHLKAKYFDEFTAKKDIHLFLGTNKFWHIRRSSNPFMIVGVFYPPK